MDLLVKIKENKWNNKSSIQLEIIDVIKSVNKTLLMHIYTIKNSNLVPSSIG